MVGEQRQQNVPDFGAGMPCTLGIARGTQRGSRTTRRVEHFVRSGGYDTAPRFAGHVMRGSLQKLVVLLVERARKLFAADDKGLIQMFDADIILASAHAQFRGVVQ